MKGVYPLKMTETYSMLKTRRFMLLLHTHTLHTQRSPVAINHVGTGEWKEAVSGDGTFYPGSRSTPPTETRGTSGPRPSSPAVWRWTLWCYRSRLPGCRWSLMNVSSGCAPSPPRPTASSCLTQLQTAAAFITACRWLVSGCLNGQQEGSQTTAWYPLQPDALRHN